MQNIKSIFVMLFLVTGLLGGTACSSTSYFLLKNHHFDTPETQGKAYKFKASLTGYQDLTAVVTDMGFTSTGPQEGDTVIVRNSSIDGYGASGLDPASILMDLALAKNIDLSLDLAVGDQPNYVKMKYQFIGDREDPDSRFSVSAIFGLGYISMKSTDATVGSVDIDSFKVTGPVIRGAISAGIRADGGLLVYWSNSYSRFFTKTDYDRALPLDDGSFNINGNQFSSMLGLNYVAGERISLGVEYGYVFANSDFAESSGFSSFAGNIGYLF
jgi:hypothetical protein